MDAAAIERPAADRSASAPHVDVFDGIRGLAIALVIWFHIWEITWQGAAITLFGHRVDFIFLGRMGFVGVEIFFFVSGFCLFWPYARALATKGPFPTVKHFAYRRFIKIVPSYLLALTILVALGSERDRSLDDGIKDVLAHVFFVHTWFQSYFGSIDGVLWSLGVEVQFYVIFPLVVLAFVRWPVLTAAAMSLVAFAWRYAVERCCSSGPFNHFHQLENNLPAFLDLFAIGMLAAWIVAVVLPRLNATTLTRLAGTAVAIGGFACIVALIWNVNSTSFLHDYAEHWQVWNRFPFGIALLVATLGSIAAFPLWHRIVANPLLVFLSVISYNLYIWHQLVARALVWVHVPHSATADPHNDPNWGILALPLYVLAGIALASVLTYGFERPLLRMRSNLRLPWRSRASVEA
jgi:peptidoglycan/LPS O-acetylase OafA/YrhL